MRVEQFRHLIAVVEHGTFSSAAELLHLTQPALSQSVRSLERQMGVELLNRQGTGPIAWSETGRLLAPYILNVIGAEDALDFELSEIGGARTGSVRLGVVNAATATILPEVLRAFHRRFPNIRLLITEASSGAIRSGVDCGDFDLGCLVESEGASSSDSSWRTALLKTDVVACVSQGHPWAHRPCVNIEEFGEVSLVLHNPGYFMRDWLDEQIAPNDQNVVYVTNNTASLLRLVEHGVGVTVLPRFSTPSGYGADLAQITVHQSGTSIGVQLTAITRDSRFLPRSVSLLLEELVRQAALFQHGGHA